MPGIDTNIVMSQVSFPGHMHWSLLLFLSTDSIFDAKRIYHTNIYILGAYFENNFTVLRPLDWTMTQIFVLGLTYRFDIIMNMIRELVLDNAYEI